MLCNFTHWAQAIWDLCNNNFFWKIPDSGSQKRITLSWKTIRPIPFQAGTSDVKIPEWGQQSSNCGKPCVVSIICTFQGTGDQHNKNRWRFLAVLRISFRMLPVVTFYGQACWSLQQLVLWILYVAHMTGAIVAPAGSWSHVSHHQSCVCTALDIRWVSESAWRKCSTLMCAWNGRCANTHNVHLKISLLDNVRMVCE